MSDPTENEQNNSDATRNNEKQANAEFYINQNHANIQNQRFIKTESYHEEHKETHAESITINNTYLQEMPKIYAESLQEFTSLLSKKFQEEHIPTAGSPIKESLNELAKASTDIDKVEDKEVTRKTIREKLKKVAVSLVRMSPKIAAAVAKVTPLSPFADLIGETFEKLVESVLPATN